jgi:hypothetical protein
MSIQLVLRCAAFAAALVPLAVTAAVYTVTNTNDSGSGSLRDAMLLANAHAGFDEIHFAIPGSGVHTIALESELPSIISPVLIDGYTQPGARVNTAGVGTNAELMIELRPATSLNHSGLILLAGSSGSTIRGLVVNRFDGVQINATAGGIDCVITGNFVGTDPTGTIGYPGGPGTRVGISAAGARCRVGGPTRGDRNLVSGLSNVGISATGDDVVVQGNLVGTTADGGAALGNSRGISVGSTTPGFVTHNVVVGGIISGTQTPYNVVSGNAGDGIEIVSGEGHRIEGNLVGLAAFPIATIPNGGAGIHVSGGSLIDIGSALDGGGNAVAGNLDAGILVSGTSTSEPQGVFIVGNTVFGNGDIPIDLAPGNVEGVTPNDTFDMDPGPNSLQNFPVLGPVTYTAAETHIHGRLHSTPDEVFRIDLYTVSSCDPSGHGGASSYVGLAGVVTDLSGNAEFDIVVPSILDSGFATATASRAVDLATSEFSACLQLGDRIFADGFDG